MTLFARAGQRTRRAAALARASPRVSLLPGLRRATDGVIDVVGEPAARRPSRRPRAATLEAMRTVILVMIGAVVLVALIAYGLWFLLARLT